jgi:hypothetical protein
MNEVLAKTKVIQGPVSTSQPLIENEPKEPEEETPKSEAKQLSPEEERAMIETELEARNLDKWCREFEKQELSRYFKERFNQHEYARQLEESAFVEARRQSLANELVSRRDMNYMLRQNVGVQKIGYQ